MKEKFKPALKDITDICKFEAWLRFYFVRDNEGTLTIDLNNDILDHVNDKYPNFVDLAKLYNKQVISPEKTQSSVINYIYEKLDGKKYDLGYIPKVIDSKSFGVEMSSFNIWMSAHENQLDQQLFDFDEWMQMFEAWKRTEKGQTVMLSLSRSGVLPNTITH